ncbi:MAG: hypothetical protein M3R50_06380 [Bacteroidota bacterium]|nr:hypothetical protein [Bacteroidota bacterium]
MNLSLFENSLLANEPPANVSVYLRALWYDAKGNWHEAHTMIQDLPDKNAAWIHAYLHRKEGDITNADYWYRNAGKRRPPGAIEKEWKEIVTALI